MQGLIEHNDAAADPESYLDLTVVVREDGTAVGGLLGYTNWDWLFVKQLWLGEEFRGRGLGRDLVHLAEEEACRRGCQHAHLDTFDCQALPFYQSLGYSVFGQLEDYPAGHTRYFLQKRGLQSRQAASV